MKVAIPTAGGHLALHFGHCEAFTFFDVDVDGNSVDGKTSREAPEHQPGLLPAWLAEQGTNVIIAGGMGSRAMNLFEQRGIQVITGAPADTPANIVESFLNGTLTTGTNVCDH